MFCITQIHCKQKYGRSRNEYKLKVLGLCIKMWHSKYVQMWVPSKYILKYNIELHGKRLDLRNPQTFNEKLQWLKLYDRNPIH